MNSPSVASPKSILIVGAGGFIGGFIASEALRRGYETWVAVRQSTSLSRLTDPRLHILTLDYDSPDDLNREIANATPPGGRWTYIIYNLGATKCVNFLDFKKINYTYLKRFTEALDAADKKPQKLLYVSSLSALGPGDEKNFTPYTGRETPHPDTAYGLSKVQAEQHLRHIAGIPYVILRPTGVYGPYEKDYLMMIKAIDCHFDFSVGLGRQMLTFIYVSDLVDAMFGALESPEALNKAYIISEPAAYSQAEFRKIVAEELGRRFVIPVKLPLFAVKAVSWIAGKWGKLRLKPTTLNPDKYKIMRQRNWTCLTDEATTDFGFVARHSLRDGIRLTVDAYRARQHR